MRKLLFFLSPLLLFADITLLQLQEAPSGRARNFNIWQFMQQDINATQAKSAYALTQGHNRKIFIKYAKKTDDKIVIESSRCSTLSTKALFKETNATCINKGLSLKKALNLTQEQRLSLSQNLKPRYESKSELILLMNDKPFILKALQSGEKNYLKLFNSLGSKNRQRYFNVMLSKERINALAKEKAFNKSIKYIVTDKKMFRMQESLLQLQACDLSAQSYFFLALNALNFKATTKAMFYLEIAQKKAYYQNNKDKALFWMYLISKEKSYLEELAQGYDLNMYTLYAKELLRVKYNNYFSALTLEDKKSKLNLQDPYVWEALLDKIRASNKEELEVLLKKYNSKEDEVLHAFIYSKVLKYKVHNYILPYKKATQDLSNDDKALLYALARQESHFIPSAISHSYALGVMQMMPFLIKALAKQRHEETKLNDMFDPYKNISYASTHLRYLQKHLYHPLFIAYAYNGGIGFTKRHLLKGTFLKGSFEPFLSMELMANTESREYGKKVLTNYVVYKKILGEDIKLIPLLEMLTEPIHTDRFRTRVLSSLP
ncbi:MAG: lytic murein transglycosylase [Arcobacter sp.]|nr:MAG: lytic murein transglycosylase [Arcobacter sp.]